MLNFADYFTMIDWGTPLLILAIGLILGFLLLAALVQWVDAWREIIQAEVEGKTDLPALDFTAEAPKVRHYRGWHTHHI